MHYVMLQKLGNIMESQISVETTKYYPVHIWNKHDAYACTAANLSVIMVKTNGNCHDIKCEQLSL